MEWMPVGCELPSTSDLRHTLQSHGRRRIVRFIGDSLSYDHYGYKYVRSCVLGCAEAKLLPVARLLWCSHRTNDTVGIRPRSEDLFLWSEDLFVRCRLRSDFSRFDPASPGDGHTLATLVRPRRRL